MSPKHSAKVLSSDVKCKKVVMCHTEKIHALENTHSGLSHTAIGCEFDVSQQPVLNNMFLKQKNKVTY